MESASPSFDGYLADFTQHPRLRRCLLVVLQSLPEEVLEDFRGDARFTVSLDNFAPGAGSTVFMAAPGGAGEGSRSVVLKPRLERSSDAFACYVIAHELAHAFLRNGPWGGIRDVEAAADALATHWGYPPP